MSIIRSRARVAEAQPAQGNAQEPRVSEEPTVTTSTYIDEGCELSGSLKFNETVKVDGRIEGDVVCQKAIIIGEPASVHSKLVCESIDIFGELQGEIDAKRMVRIHKSARVTAQIKTDGIVIEKGSRFKGLIEVGSDEDIPEVTGFLPGLQEKKDDESNPSD